MARAQGKHREFGINWSVATLFMHNNQLSNKEPSQKEMFAFADLGCGINHLMI